MLTRLSHYDPELVPRELHTAIMSRGALPRLGNAVLNLDPVSGINTIVQVWKAVDNGVQLDSKGVCSGEDKHLFTILTSMFACPSTSSGVPQRYNAGCVRSARLHLKRSRNSNVIKQKRMVDGDP
jgi:hypothetical protein